MCPFKNSNTGLVNMSKKDKISLERFTMCINYQAYNDDEGRLLFRIKNVTSKYNTKFSSQTCNEMFWIHKGELGATSSRSPSGSLIQG